MKIEFLAGDPKCFAVPSVPGDTEIRQSVASVALKIRVGKIPHATGCADGERPVYLSVLLSAKLGNRQLVAL